MNFPIEQLITWGGMVVGLLGVWFRNQFKTERLSEIIAEQDRQIKALWQWKDDHVKESTTIREVLNKDLAELRGSLLVTGEQFKQILNALDEIKTRITHLENRK
jgi:ABC-type enterochelin transport system substrate-binding protein